MTDIAINIVQKCYPASGRASQHIAIANLTFTVQQGEFICLVGPSGCGKTTLLNIIADLDHAYDGEIRLDSTQTLHPKIGYVFQNPRLLPWRTVRENIELVLDAKTPANSIDDLLESMQLLSIQHRYPERLSLGMSRRVAIIRAFAVNPDLLLMDEPIVSIDAPTARQIRSLLIKLWQQRTHSVLFVTHDLREAIALADRLIFLSAPPMQVVREINVNLPREDRDERQVELFRQQLINNYPDIQKLL